MMPTLSINHDIRLKHGISPFPQHIFIPALHIENLWLYYNNDEYGSFGGKKQIMIQVALLWNGGKGKKLN